MTGKWNRERAAAANFGTKLDVRAKMAYKKDALNPAPA
jgi:hypothetical protein